jgi:hypothetical protein
MKRNSYRAYVGVFIVSLIAAFSTGCFQTMPEPAQTDPAVVNAIMGNAERLEALAMQVERATTMNDTEETDKGGRFLSNRWSADVDNSGDVPVITAIENQTDIGSNSDLSKLSSARVDINKAEDFVPSQGSEYILPVGASVAIGGLDTAEVGAPTALQIDALSRRDTARGQQFTNQLQADGERAVGVANALTEYRRVVEQGKTARVKIRWDGAERVVTGTITSLNPTTNMFDRATSALTPVVGGLAEVDIGGTVVNGEIVEILPEER